MSEYKIVQVFWTDSQTPNVVGWMDQNEISHEPSSIETVGYLIHEDDESVTIAASVSNDDLVQGVIVIPKAVITSSCDLVQAF
ncbi:MAG: hypothetical protein AB7W16_15605 [Candidatus Obscuribacterales bacterium]